MGEKKENSGGKKWQGEGRVKRNACYKDPYWFISAVAGSCKILIGKSDNRTGLWSNANTTKMSAKVDALARALADLNVIAHSAFKLKLQ